MSSEWPLKELELIADEVTVGYVGPMASEYVEDGVPFLRSLNVEPFRINVNEIKYVTPEFHQKIKKSALRPGDVAIVRTGKPGTCAVIPDWLPDANCSDLVIVRCGEEIRPRFLCYWVNSVAAHHISSHTVGAVQQHFNVGAAKKMKVAVPELCTQDAVIEVLGSIDDRITLLHETNATLEAIAQALFKSWFVDFDPVRAKAEGRQPEGMDAATAALFPDSFEESELGLVPRGWRVATVGDVLTVTDYVANGSFAALKENVTLLDEPSYAIYVRTTDYNSGFSGGFRYVDKSAYDFLSKSSLDGSEVIISNVGDVGTVFRPPKWLGLPMTLGSNAVALKSHEMSAYLYFHFSGPLGQHNIQSIVTGSAQLKFNKTNFRALRILLPDRRCLATFEEVAKSLLLRIETNLAKAQTLTQLRDTLLPRLISGQLRLPEAEALVEEVV